MVDIFTKKKRTKIMQSIRAKDTQPELKLRKALHKLGYRYRLHRKDLPGCPDIVLPKYRTAIQVRGCFWHQHICQRGRVPKSNISYWNKKLEKNVERDYSNDQALRELGWKVIVVWECELKTEKKFKSSLQMLIDYLR